MSRIAYVNGRYLPHAAAAVGIEDRGYQFADGVYEVIEVRDGSLIDEDLHLERLARSLSAIAISAPLVPPALRVVIRQVIARNLVRNGMVYIQITRGVAGRDHYFPDPPVAPSIVITARSIDPAALQRKAETGIKVITLPDERWKRPDIKSISLLPNVLAKQEAKRQGAAEAWLYDENHFIREGAASNAWIIDVTGAVVTHPVDQTILKGVTRTTLLTLFRKMDLAFEERPFSLDEAYRAREAFVTGATTLVMPVVAIDDKVIGEGRPGATVLEFRRRFHDVAARSLGVPALRPAAT